MPPPTSETKPELVKSAVRVIELLEMFALAADPLGVSDVARRMQVPKSSAQDLLATLASLGYLDRDGSEYVLPQSLRGAGWVGGPIARLTRFARPLMRRIADASGESAFLGVLTRDRQVRYIAKEVSVNEVRYDASLAHARPVHGTSIGLVMLAFLPPGEREAYLRGLALEAVTPRTLTDAAELERLLARIAQQGYAEVRDTNVMGASGISAPVFRPGGHVIAGLNLGAPSFRYPKARALMRQQVIEGAKELTALLARGSNH